MPLRSTVSSLSKSAPAQDAPPLRRRPGMYTSPVDAPDILAPDEPEIAVEEPAPVQETAPMPTAPKPRAAPRARKPRTPKAPVPGAVASDDAKAARALLQQVEGDILDLRAQMNKALARFQPKLDKLQARHAELSAALVKALTR